MGENAERVRQGIELFNEAKIPELLDLYHPETEIVAQGTITGGAFTGKAGAMEWFRKIGAAYPEGVHLEVENLYESGDAVIVEWNAKGKLASGERFEGKSLNVLEFRDGKVSKHRFYSDTEALARAMGKL